MVLIFRRSRYSYRTKHTILHGKHRKPSVESISNVDIVFISRRGSTFLHHSASSFRMECLQKMTLKSCFRQTQPSRSPCSRPMLDPSFSSFVGLALPIIHGTRLGKYSMATEGGWKEEYKLN